MSCVSAKRRIFFLSNPDKPEAAAALEELHSFAASRCEVVGLAHDLDGSAAIDANADRIVVLGGDGTLIGVARSLGDKQIPLIGVNVGKLGFLAEFSVDELKGAFDRALADDTLVDHRAMLNIEVHRDGNPVGTYLAMNDCVIQAGPPFRIIRLGLRINGEHLTELGGDGLIVCTPSGSTAHNLSAGGPIMQPGVEALILTPMNPHSLTHKPLVIEHDAVIDIYAVEVNPGTAAIVDGQVSCALSPGDRISVRRSDASFLVVRNPLYAKWHKLVTKLHWGQSPDYG